MSKTARDIVNNLIDLQDQAEEIIINADGEITEEAEQVLSEIDSMQMEAVDKVKAYEHVIRKMEDAKASVEGMKAHYYDRYKSFHNKLKAKDKEIRKMKDRLVTLMETADVKSVKTGTATVFLTERSKQSLDVSDLSVDDIEELVFMGLGEMKPELDKKAIMSKLESGDLDAECLRKISVNETKTTSVTIR